MQKIKKFKQIISILFSKSKTISKVQSEAAKRFLVDIAPMVFFTLASIVTIVMPMLLSQEDLKWAWTWTFPGILVPVSILLTYLKVNVAMKDYDRNLLRSSEVVLKTAEKKSVKAEKKTANKRKAVQNIQAYNQRKQNKENK